MHRWCEAHRVICILKHTANHGSQTSVEVEMNSLLVANFERARMVAAARLDWLLVETDGVTE